MEGVNLIFRCVGQNVLIRQIQVSKSTGYGQTELIEIPSNHEKVIQFFGEVLAVGKKATSGVGIGDYVLVETYSQYVFETGTEDTYLLVQDEDIAAIFDEIPNYLDCVPTGSREYAEVA
jgi:co-chaperonin GroES (HSP10)